MENNKIIDNTKKITDNLFLQNEKIKYLLLLLEDTSIHFDCLGIKNNKFNDTFNKIVVLIDMLKDVNNSTYKDLSLLWDNIVNIS